MFISPTSSVYNIFFNFDFIILTFDFILFKPYTCSDKNVWITNINVHYSNGLFYI